MTFLAQLNEAMGALDHAASQDMRWWFLGLLLVMGVAVWWLAKYFGARHDRLSNRLDQVQDQRTEYLEKQGAMMQETLRDNASAFREFSRAIGSIKHLFDAPRERT